MIDNYSDYFAGKKLYGDDFSIAEIIKWYEDEEEAYANLGSKNKHNYSYQYHELNKYHGYNFIEDIRFDKVLGLGSAYGHEFKPIIFSIGEINILDSSDAFSELTEVFGIPCQYKKPNASGDIPFETSTFNLVTSLGVLHHIPNVSHVLSECYRCLKENGVMLIREPIKSMGDWRHKRNGLTKRERGIPIKILDSLIKEVGFTVINRSLCFYSPLTKLTRLLGVSLFNNKTLVALDSWLCNSIEWNIKYHDSTIIEKFTPSCAYYVLKK
jgi:SAM-dependent methyltransferase